MDSPTALVALGSNWISIARLPRVLHGAGYRVEVLCPAEWALAHTRFADERHDSPPDVAGAAAALRARLAKRRYDLAIVGDDPLLAHLCAQRDPGWLAPWFPVAPESASLAVASSKAAFVPAAAAAGVAVPQSHLCASPAEVREALERLGGTAILKPARAHAGMGVRLLQPGDALELPPVDPAHPFVVQEYVRGRVGNTIALLHRGRPLQWLAAYKSRTWPGAFGPSCAKEPLEHEGLCRMLDAVGRMTGFHGFAGLDWIEEEGRGRFVALELNARPAPGIHLGAACGADFAPALRGFTAAEPGAGPRSPPPERVVSMFPEDVLRAVAVRDEPFLSRWREDRALREDVPWDDEPLLQWHLRRRPLRRLFDGVRP